MPGHQNVVYRVIPLAAPFPRAGDKGPLSSSGKLAGQIPGSRIESRKDGSRQFGIVVTVHPFKLRISVPPEVH